MAVVNPESILFVDNILDNVDTVSPDGDDSPRFVIVPNQEEVLLEASQDIACVSTSEVDSQANSWIILDDDSVVKDSSPTVVEILVEADPKESPEKEFDESKPIEITDESVVTVNGKTCVLRTNPETGSLFAYPSKRKPGRPPKTAQRGITTDDASLESEPSEVKLVIAPHQSSEPSSNTGRPVNRKRKRGRATKSKKEPSFASPPLISVRKPDGQEPWLEAWKCTLCGHQSLYAQQSQDHLRTYHVDVVQKCRICLFVCVEEADLVEHYRSTHPKNYCHYCGLTSDKAYIVKRHMMRHTMEASCDLCGKVFKDKYILKMHRKMVHMTEKTNFFECQVCGKKFTRSNHLTRHMHIHDGERSFKCPHCNYRGIEKADVTKHMLVHDEPKFTCEICNKLFRQSKNLDLHMKRHNQQRDYKCGICDFLGYTFTDIRKHIERAHQERCPMYCEKCESVFKSLNECIEHYTTGPCEPTLLEDCVETDSVIITSDSVTHCGKKEQRTWNQGESHEEPILNEDLYNMEVEESGQALSDEHWTRVVQTLDGYTTVDVNSTATSHSPDNQQVDVEPADDGGGS